jgi:hypothetical protein
VSKREKKIFSIKLLNAAVSKKFAILKQGKKYGSGYLEIRNTGFFKNTNREKILKQRLVLD